MRGASALPLEPELWSVVDEGVGAVAGPLSTRSWALGAFAFHAKTVGNDSVQESDGGLRPGHPLKLVGGHGDFVLAAKPQIPARPEAYHLTARRVPRAQSSHSEEAFKPSPLPIRIGLAGAASKLQPDTSHSAQRSQREWFASLYVRGFHAHAYAHTEPLAPGDVPHVVAQAARYNVELHAWHFEHPLREAEYQRPFLPYAARSVLLRRALNARAWGARSFTYRSGPLAAYDVAGFEEEARHILEGLSQEPGAPRLHVMNPPTRDSHLWRVRDLVDFARRVRGVGLLLHLGHAWAAGHRDFHVDAWRQLLHELPAGTLFLYANMDGRWGEYKDRFIHHTGSRPPDAEPPTPPLRPFLEALAESKRRTTLFVRGGRRELDAEEVFVEACDVYGVDPEPVLQERERFGLRPKDHFPIGLNGSRRRRKPRGASAA